MTLSAFSDELAQVRTKKKAFLEQIDRIIPWSEWAALIQPCYYKGERGNKPYDLELMLRIYMLQNLYDLSDKGTVAEVIDSRAFSDFCGEDSSNQVPNGDTLGRFRNLLIRNGLQGNTWHFGYKAHIGVDRDSGLVHTVKVTAANVHDVSMTPELLHGEEETVNGDSGYVGAEKREDALVRNKKGKKIRYEINRRPSQIRKLSKSGQYKAKKREHAKSSVRCKVEHVFGVVKGLLKYKKTRYRGLQKQTTKFNIMFALANLILARPSHKLCKPPMWCRIGAPYWRFYL